ncbi:MAG TPA: RNA 2',3'-cyclic phosphodiesterase [Pyrinomonadaceae bacterium]
MAEDATNRRGKAGGESVLCLRLFFAVELPLEIRAAAAEHAARLRREFPDARASWPRAESLHLTLKFLGEVEAIRLDALHHVAEVAAAALTPFALTIEGTGTFPPRGAARVLWLGVRDDDGQLSRLQFRLDKEGVYVGFPRESKSFRPHLTLARLRDYQRSEAAHGLCEAHRRAPFGPLTFEVSDFVLMRSELGPGGSRYTPLSRHAF